MKLLVDMNLSPRWIAFLGDAGWEATHWSAVGKAEASDSEIMAYAAVNNYVVLTNDLDFAAILAASGQKKPSVAQIRAQDLSPIVIGSQIVAALARANRIGSGRALDHRVGSDTPASAAVSKRTVTRSGTCPLLRSRRIAGMIAACR